MVVELGKVDTAPNKLWLPRLEKEIDRPWFLPDQQSLREQHAILTSIFYIVKQGDSFGERLPCTRCGNRHDYITLQCINKPHTGMTQGLYAYYRLVKDNNMEHSLPPEQRARYRNIIDMLGGMPDLSTIHPQLARKLSADMGWNDAKLGAISLGVLEGISPREAQKLTERINDTGLKPRYRLPKPSGVDEYRAIDLVRNNDGLKVHWTS